MEGVIRSSAVEHKLFLEISFLKALSSFPAHTEMMSFHRKLSDKVYHTSWLIASGLEFIHLVGEWKKKKKKKKQV